MKNNATWKYSDEVTKIIKHYTKSTNFIFDTKEFVKEVLHPCKERYDMTYRYEHTLRVTENGKKIAQASGLDDEMLVLACLLHDIGYKECKTFEDLRNHPKYSALIASDFLTKIGYPSEKVSFICRAIEIHDLTNELPEEVTPFLLSVRDADDIDRFSTMRAIIKINSFIGENDKDTIISNCNKEINYINFVSGLKRGTETAQQMMEKCTTEWLQLVQKLKQQMEMYYE